MDKLKAMFHKQEKFQQALGQRVQSQEFRTLQTLAAIVELAEFIQETPWKPWKKDQKLELARAQEELADVQHFVVNLALSLGMDSQTFYAVFMRKNAKNKRRQKEGY